MCNFLWRDREPCVYVFVCSGTCAKKSAAGPLQHYQITQKSQAAGRAQCTEPHASHTLERTAPYNRRYVCVRVCVSVCAPSRSPRKLWPPWPWGAHAAELGGGEGSGHLALPVVRHWLPVHDDLAVRRPAELDRLGGVDARRARVAGRPEPVSATAGASAAGAGLGARPSDDSGAPVLLRRRRGARADAGVDGAGDGVP